MIKEIILVMRLTFLLKKILLLWMNPLHFTAGTWDVMDSFMDNIREKGLSKSKTKRETNMLRFFL